MERIERRPRVLIVDDEVIIAEDLRQRLIQSGYDVIGPVSSGAEAVHLAQTSRPDVALMDILLRGPMDGVEAAARISEEFLLPVVFITACSDLSTVERARSLPMASLLVKPFEDRELQLAMELAVTRKELHQARLQNSPSEGREPSVQLAGGSNQHCVLGCDENGIVRFLGGGTRSLLGLAKDVIGRATLNDLFTPAARGDFKGKIHEALQGRTVHIEARLKDSPDPARWFSITLAPQNGSGFLAVAEDVTEEKRNSRRRAALYAISEAAHTVHGLEELYRSIHLCVSDVLPAENFYIALHDKTHDLLFFPYFVDQFDPPPAPRAVGRGLTEYVLRHGKPLFASPELFRELIARGEVQSIGEPSVDWLGVPLILDDTPIGVLVVQTYSEGVRYTQEDLDILSFVSRQVAMAIDRKKKEETLRESEAELRSLFEGMDALVLVISRNGTFLNIAPTHPSLLYRLPDLLHQKTVHDLFPHEQAEFFLSRIQIVLQEGHRMSIEFPMDIAGGGRWFEGTLSPAGPQRVILVAHDITDRRRMETSFHEARETYKGIFDHAAMGIAKCTVDGRFISVNNALMRMYGYTNQPGLLEEMTRRKGQLYIESGRKDDLEALLQSNREVSDFESQVTRNGGGQFWISENIKLVSDEDGNPLHYIVTVQDITSKKLAERELRLLANTVACARDCFLLTNLEGSILFVNDAFIATYGYSADELVGKSPVLLGGNGTAHEALEEAYLPSSGSWSGEITAARSDGTVFPAEIRTSTVRDEAGKPVAFVTVARDIGDRKQNEEKIRNNELRLRRITDTMLDVITQVDTHGVCEYASPSHLKVLGYQPDALMGQSLLPLIYPADRTGMLAVFRRLYREATSGTAEYRFRKSGGGWIWVESLINPLLDDAGKVTGFVVGSLDVTQRKKADEALRLNEARLEGLVSLNQMFDASTQRIAEFALEEGVRLTRSEIGFVGFLSPDGNTIESVIWSKRSQELCGLQESDPIAMLSPSGMFRHAILRREPVIYNQLSGRGPGIAPLPGRHVPIDRFMCIPVFDGENVLAIAGVGNKEEEYDTSDARQLTLLFEGMVVHMQRQHAQQELRKSLEEKEILLKEVHHRVKNNLQIISSLLSLQLGHVQDSSIAQLLRESQNRIRSMALIHERLYRSGDLSRIDFGTYVHNLISYLVRSYPVARMSTKIRVNIEGILLGVDMAIPCGLIVNELVSNSLIHGFTDGRAGEVSVEMTQNESVARLTVRDNGVGLPPGFSLRNVPTLGLQLIETLVDQIDGVIDLDTTAGTSFSVVFKIT
ncbi:MAG: PAS domain S-box protein [Bacteroidota bacterium]